MFYDGKETCVGMGMGVGGGVGGSRNSEFPKRGIALNIGVEHLPVRNAMSTGIQ